MNFIRPLKIMFICAAANALVGCATTSSFRLAQANMKEPLKILLVQSPVSIEKSRLESVFAPGAKQPAPAGSLSRWVAHAQDQALSAMKSTLANQPMIALVPPPTEGGELMNAMQGKGFEAALSQDDADRIRSTTGADALLKFKITDYGLTPKAWRSGYITFEVTSTLAVAAVIAYSGTAVAKAAAGAYLVQETVEETAEAYAGFRALDDVCRPVRIEAELVSLKPVAAIWKTSDTGLSDVRISRLFRKVGADELEAQLDQATDSAVKDVVTDLVAELHQVKPADTTGMNPQMDNRQF